MRLGIGSYTYTWAIGVPGREPARKMTAMALLEEAVRLGVSVVQICDNLPITDLPDAELDACERFARQHGIQIELGTRGASPAQLRQYLGLARRFDCEFLRIVVHEKDRPFDRANVLSQLREVLPEFQRDNVKLAIENYDWSSLDELVRLVEELGAEHCGICLDTVNSFGAPDGIRGVVELLAPYTLNLHLKDFTVRRVNSQMGFVVEGCAAGSGDLDVPWLLGRMRALGRDVNAIVELWTPERSSVEETIELERTLAEASVRCLRNYIPD